MGGGPLLLLLDLLLLELPLSIVGGLLLVPLVALLRTGLLVLLSLDARLLKVGRRLAQIESELSRHLGGGVEPLVELPAVTALPVLSGRARQIGALLCNGLDLGVGVVDRGGAFASDALEAGSDLAGDAWDDVSSFFD